MKVLGKLKLNQISKTELAQRQMAQLFGGGGSCCLCACRYANYEGSSTLDNGVANRNGGVSSPAGGYDAGGTGS
jgi:natural product precursor